VARDLAPEMARWTGHGPPRLNGHARGGNLSARRESQPERTLSNDDGRLASWPATYFDSWKHKEFDALRAILADNVTFEGPLGTAGNADECIAGLRGMAQMMTDIVVRKRFVGRA